MGGSKGDNAFASLVKLTESKLHSEEWEEGTQKAHVSTVYFTGLSGQ